MCLTLAIEGREKGNGTPEFSKAINHQRYPEKPPHGPCNDESVAPADDNSLAEGSVQLPGDLAQECCPADIPRGEEHQ